MNDRLTDSFGARLRQHRQARKIPLRTIAEQTKIKLSMLEGLEKDDISQWPAGIFRRAYVRSYANAAGLDPDTTIREFLERYPESAEPVQETLDHNGPPPTRFRTLIGSALGRFRRSEPTTSAPEPTGPPEPAAAVSVTRTGSDPDRAPLPGPAPRPVSVATSGRAEAVVPDWLAAARVCTELGRVQRLADVKPLLGEAARILGAVGLIVWVWDGAASQLRPALAHGYSNKLMARMRGVERDADNLTAAAFRSSEVLAVAGEGSKPGALAMPLLSPSGCAGVLAIELARGAEQSAPTRAAATFFAAMLAQLFGGEPVASPASISSVSSAAPAASGKEEAPPLSAYPGDRMLPATSQ